MTGDKKQDNNANQHGGDRSDRPDQQDGRKNEQDQENKTQQGIQQDYQTER